MFDRRGAGERKKEMRSKCFRGMMKVLGSGLGLQRAG